MLLDYEKSEKLAFIDPRAFKNAAPDVEVYAITLMVDEGLLAVAGRGTIRITSAGHDFLDAVRDDSIWAKTTAVASDVGGSSTTKLLKDIAYGFLKVKVEKHTGIEL